MKRLTLLFQIFITTMTIAQVPDPPYNPMTSPGARGISILIHTLYWQNPSGVLYNEVYFSDDSASVANNDTSARVKNGFPDTTFSSYPLNEYGPLNGNTKYFWKVVEYNLNGASISPLWYFKSFAITYFEYQCSFDNGFEGWQFFGPLGINNWFWSNTSHAGSTPGELAFRWDPIFIGDSYFMSPKIIVPPGDEAYLNFKYYEDWWSDTVVVGCAITTDNGLNWISVWDLHATGNVGPEDVSVYLEVQDSLRIGFYYTGNSNNIDFLYVDSIYISSTIPLTPPYPPGMLSAFASDSLQKVSLNWTVGGGISGLYGYELQRKNGTPNSNTPYITIATTDFGTLNYEDFDVELNLAYTYRVRSLVMGFNSQYGNEATAYVPASVPVELLSFSRSVIDNNVTLNWTTATETNNSGFQVERSVISIEGRNPSWESISFINGHGTTTEAQTYFYKDENLSTGKYQYRLKQIDFDGTFEFSNIVEAEILPPLNFSLEQNYPNPFNPTTKISWQSPVGSWQILNVFDVLGNEVVTLVNEFKPSGIYEVEFDASKFSSGVYYYQIKAGEFIQTKKMILMK